MSVVQFSTDFVLKQKNLADAWKRAEKRWLFKVGGLMRMSIRRGYRRRKKVSSPGNPPNVHTGDKIATLKNVRFEIDFNRSDVISGAVKLNQTEVLDGSQSTVPQIHEFGGTARIAEESFDGQQWFRRDKRKSARPWKQYRTRTARYPKRPNAAPTLDRLSREGKLAHPFKNSVRAA